MLRNIDDAIKKQIKLKIFAEATDDKRAKEEHEQLAELLKELKFLRQWKSDVIDEFCKYDCNSVEEARHNAYNKAIDEAICKVEEHKAKGYVTGITNNPFEFGACQMADDIVKILKQLKVGEQNEQKSFKGM